MHDNLLTFTVVAALVTTAGTLLGLFLKEFLLARSFEKWKLQQSLREVSRKYRDPIALAAVELANRLARICDSYPPDYLDSQLLITDAQKSMLKTADDPYYKRQMLVSSVYRLCSFLGWIELYRQDTAFLEPDQKSASSKVNTAIYAIRADLADGQLNDKRDWDKWSDALIFREEQRAIGESMITFCGTNRTVIGFSEFWELFLGDVETSRRRWINAVSIFLLDPQPKKDFRLERMKRMVVHLVDLVECLDPSRLRDTHGAAREKWRHTTEERSE
jgi:hypothetical protein